MSAIDGMPMSIDANRVPLRLAPSLPELDFTTDSLYDALDAHGHRPARADYDVEARAVEAEEAELLELEPGSPVLHISRRAFCRENVVEVTRSVYRADRYTLWVPVLRPEHLR